MTQRGQEKNRKKSIIRMRAYKIAATVLLCTFAAVYWHAEAYSGRIVFWNSFQDTDAPAVRVEFIGESLCPDCAAFTTDILDLVYRSDLKKIVDLVYVGWGNAKNSSGAPECQHGARECKLNKALNCAQHYSRTQEDFFIFLLCLEKTAFSTDDDEVLETCSSHANLSEDTVRQCMDGKLGQQSRVLHDFLGSSAGTKLEVEAAQATPPHQYVPWILVDGVPLGADCGMLVTYICTAYHGEKPRVCSEPQPTHKCPGAPSQDAAGLLLDTSSSQ